MIVIFGMAIKVLVFEVVVNTSIFLLWCFCYRNTIDKEYLWGTYKEDVIKSYFFIAVQVVLLFGLISMVVGEHILNTGIKNLEEGLNALNETKS